MKHKTTGLMVFEERGDAFTTSSAIAIGAKVTERAVYLLIEKHISDLAEFGQLSFEMIPVKYARGTNEKKVYHLNEQQATLLITYLRNTEPVRAFKMELVKQFFAMRQMIQQRQNAEWIEARAKGKLVRRYETDAIKKLVEYAKEQGSEHADMLYMNYTRLVNDVLGIERRDMLPSSGLARLQVAEELVKQSVESGMESGVYYKEIYKRTKETLGLLRSLPQLV